MADIKLKVAMGTIYPYDESRVRGGVEAVALYLVHALAKCSEIDLHVVSCNRTVKHDAVECRNGVTYHWLAKVEEFHDVRAATIDAWRVSQLYAQLQPSVIHAQGFSEYALANKSFCPLVLTIHGVEPLVPLMLRTAHYRGVVGIYRRLMWAWFASQSIRNAAAIISIAGEYIPKILGSRLKNKCVYTVFNPISDDFFQLPNTDRCDPPMVLWVGKISERKNVLGLLQSFEGVVKHVPTAVLLIIGRTEENDYLSRIKREIVARGLSGNVRLAGQIEHAEILNAYADASVIAMTSIEETAPMCIAQAMAAGKPVVSTRVGGTPSMIEEGISGYLVDTGDMNSMSMRLVELLCNPKKQRDMGNAARSRARKLFSADLVAQQTVHVYSDLLNRI
jgi:glycosyltransferase involved in cell wall biosynthesis